MTSEQLFDNAGRALFGDLYVAALADLIGVDKNTISKWRNGKALVPAGVWRSILEEIETRERVLGLLRNEIVDVAAPRSDGRVDAIGPHYPANAAGTLFGGTENNGDAPHLPTPVVVRRNPNNLTIELSREARPADVDAFRRSFNEFADRLGLRRGVVAGRGHYMQALLRDNLEGTQPRALREWFADECARIDREG